MYGLLSSGDVGVVDQGLMIDGIDLEGHNSISFYKDKIESWSLESAGLPHAFVQLLASNWFSSAKAVPLLLLRLNLPA